jgi:protocatechuate 3,4-dioxygenase beta subunit
MQRIVAYLRTVLPCSLFLSATIALLTTAPLLAQTPTKTGGIQGTVFDPADKVIVKAQVTATNTSTGAQSTTHSDTEGQFSLSSLPPGNYNLEVHANGFLRKVLENINVGSGQSVRLKPMLEVDPSIVAVYVSVLPPYMGSSNTSGVNSVAGKSSTQPTVEQCRNQPPSGTSNSPAPRPVQLILNGCLQGVITDLNGKPVADATIHIVNTDTGEDTSTHGSNTGAYSFNPLPVGTYWAEVYTNSFQRQIIDNINVDSYRPTTFNIKLTPLEPNQLPNDTDIPRERFYPDTPVALVPLFRDPIHDGAADPVVVWNRARKRWWMFYTNRRADLADTNGVTWVHGTHIGIAESADGGANWKYVSEADIPVPTPETTLWAPEIIDTGGTYHMFLTVVPGTFTGWNHPRHILHLTSKDLLHWKPLANANLESDRTIDACLFRLPSGLWRLWYKNEADSSKVYFSDSPDLVHWTPKGIATTNHGEGPVVFQWRGFYWLINDPHAGLAVFRSSDLTNWQQQPRNLLSEPGTRPTDRAMGNHADVVVDGSGRAWLFYFTQQSGADAQGHDPGWARRSALHVTELHEANGILTVDRNAPATIDMIPPPINKKSDMAGAW